MKKLVILTGCICLFGLISYTQTNVIANITNIRSNDGVCRACLFSNELAFRGKSSPANCIAVGVKNKLATAVFFNVKPGSYAVFVFHDVNNNLKMDKNILGIPKEGYGASNNKLPFASAPHFEDNKFIVSNNHIVSLNIHLRNFF